MIVYGMVYKRGHKRKNWQMRLFVLDGSTCNYYELGTYIHNPHTHTKHNTHRAEHTEQNTQTHKTHRAEHTHKTHTEQNTHTHNTQTHKRTAEQSRAQCCPEPVWANGCVLKARKPPLKLVVILTLRCAAFFFCLLPMSSPHHHHLIINDNHQATPI